MFPKLQANTVPEALTEPTAQKCGQSLQHRLMLAYRYGLRKCGEMLTLALTLALM